MTVYVVLNSYIYNGSYDDYLNDNFYGVFSTEEKAKEFIFAKYEKVQKDKTDIKIEDGCYKFSFEDDYDIYDIEYKIVPCELDDTSKYMDSFI